MKMYVTTIPVEVVHKFEVQVMVRARHPDNVAYLARNKVRTQYEMGQLISQRREVRIGDPQDVRIVGEET